MHEQSGSYKLEDGIRFNARDCAVMRGFLEKIPVLLTSSASFHGVMGKCSHWQISSLGHAFRNEDAENSDHRYALCQKDPTLPFFFRNRGVKEIASKE